MRKELRQRVQRKARIDWGGQTPVFCSIDNLSHIGALLIVANAENFPETFVLTDLSANSSRLCQVIWARTDRLGVRFIEGEPTPKKRFGRRGMR
jgi:hypothetical protein